MFDVVLIAIQCLVYDLKTFNNVIGLMSAFIKMFPASCMQIIISK